jgi:hypothetical protein
MSRTPGFGEVQTRHVRRSAGLAGVGRAASVLRHSGCFTDEVRFIRLDTLIAAPIGDCFDLFLVLDHYLPRLLGQRNAWLKATLEARS